MTLKELIGLGLIKDNDIIRIKMDVFTTPDEIKGEHWFADKMSELGDKMLEVLDAEIDSAEYTAPTNRALWDVIVGEKKQ